MSGSAKKLLHAAAGSASGDPVYVEDVFSIDLSVGTGSNITVNNGIDLSGEGGLVIWRRRDGAENWNTQDTVRGVNSIIYTDSSNAAADPGSYGLDSFNSNGFTAEANAMVNAGKYCSWTFRKQEGFFDVVTWTGSNDSSTDIGKGIVAHNLGCKPGLVLIKNTDQASTDWIVWHKGLTSGYYIKLNSTAAETNSGAVAYFSKYDGGWSQTDPDASNIYVGYNYQTNANTETMVAYVFADGAESNAQIFGDDGDEAIIKTGSFSHTSGTPTFVNCGFEAAWVMVKRTDDTDSWWMADDMRGFTPNGISTYTPYLAANSNAAEGTSDWIGPNAQGFDFNYLTGSYVYIAIRRGPMKEPSAGTDVFMADRAPNTSPAFVSGFPVDFGYSLQGTAGGGTTYITTRMTGTKLFTTLSASAQANNNNYTFDFQNGMYNYTSYANAGGTLYTIGHMWRRYPKVFDVVAYTGTGSTRTVTHNLGVAPEMMLIKNREQAYHWEVYHSAISPTDGVYLTNDGSASGASFAYASTQPTASVFTVGSGAGVNNTNKAHIALLFASLDGISKVGSYTGTGNDINVTGLGAAARYVLIKRTDADADWYVFDSVEQGIVAGNDTYQILNGNSAAVTNQDYIDPHSSGFTVTSSAPAALNASGGTYLYLAFA